MKVIIGIDIGGSATKIVGFQQTTNKELIQPLYVKTADPITSIYGAFGKFLSTNNLELTDVEMIHMTGVGSTFQEHSIYNLPCMKVNEFDSIGRGGLYLSKLKEALVVSMGTGTAIVHAKEGEPTIYMGGTGVGGGTFTGLAKLLLKIDQHKHVEELAHNGDISKIDLTIGDIMNHPSMNKDMTAANFGKLSDLATKEDIALGITNMVFETIGMMAIFAARTVGLKDIVLTGSLSNDSNAIPIFNKMSKMFDVNFIIPDHSQFATVIGAALGE